MSPAHPHPCARCGVEMLVGRRVYCAPCYREHRAELSRLHEAQRGPRERSREHERQAANRRVQRALRAGLHAGEPLFDADGVQVPVAQPGRCQECGTRLNRWNRGEECGPCFETRKARMLDESAAREGAP